MKDNVNERNERTHFPEKGGKLVMNQPASERTDQVTDGETDLLTQRDGGRLFTPQELYMPTNTNWALPFQDNPFIF